MQIIILAVCAGGPIVAGIVMMIAGMLPLGFVLLVFGVLMGVLMFMQHFSDRESTSNAPSGNANNAHPENADADNANPPNVAA
jgi:Na+-transporting methylmalonyl-CoA/oxaloacetate decarboxylase gamma subunit